MHYVEKKPRLKALDDASELAAAIDWKKRSLMPGRKPLMPTCLDRAGIRKAAGLVSLPPVFAVFLSSLEGMENDRTYEPGTTVN
jgi:hypothetical protein